jgi:hypothetical protein
MLCIKTGEVGAAYHTNSGQVHLNEVERPDVSQKRRGAFRHREARSNRGFQAHLGLLVLKWRQVWTVSMAARCVVFVTNKQHFVYASKPCKLRLFEQIPEI